MLVASLDATCGSVITNEERMTPSLNGCKYLSFCWALPNRCRVSMLPVSGNLVLQMKIHFRSKNPRRECTLLRNKMRVVRNEGMKEEVYGRPVLQMMPLFVPKKIKKHNQWPLHVLPVPGN
tara:strand:+ start:1223 stop:1585 length:363 start_codon:yes stop_codon:yes gene_type:complete